MVIFRILIGIVIILLVSCETHHQKTQSNENIIDYPYLIGKSSNGVLWIFDENSRNHYTMSWVYKGSYYEYQQIPYDKDAIYEFPTRLFKWQILDDVHGHLPTTHYLIN